MAMTKEVLLTNARNDGSGRGIAGRDRNDAEERGWLLRSSKIFRTKKYLYL